MYAFDAFLMSRIDEGHDVVFALAEMFLHVLFVLVHRQIICAPNDFVKNVGAECVGKFVVSYGDSITLKV